MIISDEHRYLFIEIPITASSTIHDELYTLYNGRSILHKHATYTEFARQATEQEKGYFVFAATRHPLDKLVSLYTKIKSDHRGGFSRQQAAEEFLVDFSDLKKFEFIHNRNASFPEYFRSYYRRPYSDLIDYSADALDFVIRYEHLQEDFARVLGKLGLEQVRPLPVKNKTKGRRDPWETYYSPEIIARAKKVCGPYMERWGYDFPASWGDGRVSWLNRAEYRFYNLLRHVYVNFFKYNSSGFGKAVRRLRATVK